MRRRASRLAALASWITLFLATPTGGGAQEPYRSRCGAGVHVEDRLGTTALPQGSLFCPMLADPKSEHSYLSYLRGDFATLANPAANQDTNIGAVGIADNFGLLRFASGSVGDGLQLDVMGGVFAQFNLDAESFDLINADYVVGLPLTARFGGFTARFRPYHQSSHLGDEFLLAARPERENVSFEALELILSMEVSALRIYAGGENFFRAEPVDLVSKLAHAGIELRPGLFGSGRLVAAYDLKVIEQLDWQWASSARAGIEIARVPNPGHPPRVLALLAHWYEGPAPYGQFYRDNIRFLGAGLHFSP
jgi:hypothetical protein